ncbi:MAG TPA: hypothetical protein VHX61_17665 [Rhizomicrobium sp.]|nr:hypothetical protein [Rhizomicrobium sp.]
MDANRPSRTAQGAAMRRAAHQLLDRPLVFEYALALRIIGSDAETELRHGRDWHGFATPGVAGLHRRPLVRGRGRPC